MSSSSVGLTSLYVIEGRVFYFPLTHKSVMRGTSPLKGWCEKTLCRWLQGPMKFLVCFGEHIQVITRLVHQFIRQSCWFASKGCRVINADYLMMYGMKYVWNCRFVLEGIWYPLLKIMMNGLIDEVIGLFWRNYLMMYGLKYFSSYRFILEGI